MSTIIDQLKDAISPELLSSLAKTVGEEEGSVKKALQGVFPLLLGLVTKKTTGSSPLLGQLMSLFRDNASGGGASALENPSVLSGLFSGQGDLSGKVDKFLSLILDGKSEEVASGISAYAGVRKSSASSLLEVAAANVMGLLGKKAAAGNFSPKALTSLLSAEKGNILKALPSGLAMAGLGDLNQLGVKVEEAAKDITRGKGSLLKPLTIVVAAVIAALFLFRSCNKENMTSTTVSRNVDVAATSVQNTVDDAAKAVSETINSAVSGADKAVDETKDKIAQAADSAVTSSREAANNLWEHLGAMTGVTLPNGVELNVPSAGVENRLLAFIQDTDKPVDDSSWFSFDRLVFETGSATLKPDSNEQLHNIAQIMEAFPAVQIKLGGYTDNTGTDDVNMKISQDRADAVKNELLRLGVDNSRITAEGYGQQYPVAPNDTDENRAKNRRIDILVTQK